MPKDGPPSSSSGYRFGGLAAFRSGLPPKAATPRGPRTDAELKAGESLADFTDYFGRTKSIGQPSPKAQRISPERAANLQKAQEQEKKLYFPVATLAEHNGMKLRLMRCGRYYLFVEEREHGYRKSFVYRKDRAMCLYHQNRITFIEFIKGPLPSEGVLAWSSTNSTT
jgi:hypothetical protein